MAMKRDNIKVPNFLDYAREKELPLANIFGKGAEGFGVLIKLTKKEARFRMESGIDVIFNLNDAEERDLFVMVDQKLEDRMKIPFDEGWGDKSGHYVTLERDRQEGIFKSNQCKKIPGFSTKCKDVNNLIFNTYFSKKEPISDEIWDEFKSLYPKKRENSKFKKYNRYGENVKVATHSFFGSGAQDIEIPKPEDFVVALAYLSSPGKVSFIADVPPNHEEEFTKLYPYAHFGHTKSHNGGSCQFTMAIHGSKDMPTGLHADVMPNDQSKIGNDESIRIIRSAFTYDLIENRGFMFGKKQDPYEILNRIPDEYKDIYKEHYEHFSGIDLDKDELDLE